MDLPRPLSHGDVREAASRPRATRTPAFVVGVIRSFFADDGVTWAAGMAFYLVLSIPPLLIGVVALGDVAVGRDELVKALLGRITQVIPGEGGTVEGFAAGRGRDVAVAGVLALAWILVSGSRIFGVLTAAITGMWDVPRKGTLIQREVLRFALLVGGLVVLAVAALVSAWAGDLGPDSSPARFVGWLLGAQLVPLILVLAALTLLYLAVPPGKARVQSALAGALVATVLLRLIEFAFIEIFQASSGWQSVYGPLAGVALLMTWAIASCASIVIGAEVVILLERPDRVDQLGRGAPGEENRDAAKESGSR
jgi:membrane protein